MEPVYIIIAGIGALIALSILLILIPYNIKYKGKCIIHDWEYKISCEWTWEINRRYVCKKCQKIEKA